MSNDDSRSPSPPAAAPGPSETPAPQEQMKPLQAAIERFALAVTTLGTHPDSGMFFFDAQELAVNEKLQGLKLQALVDLLCAKGLIQRYEFENRLEDLVLQKAARLEEGIKQLRFAAIHTRPVVKANGR